MYTRTTTPPHHPYVLTNERSYAQGDQYTHHDQLSPNQYTQRTSTTVTTPNQYTITHTPPRTLIRVSDARGRVLSSNATAKTTTRSTSANGARHRVRTTQGTAILPCYALTNTPLNNGLPRLRKSWRENHHHADGTRPAYYSDVSCNPE